MGKGRGFGKAILFGEHFVVYGLPGMAGALSDYTEAVVEHGTKGLEFVDNRPETPGYKEKKRDEIQRQLDALVRHFNLDLTERPIKITLSGTLVCASGVGASAALAAGIARALSEELGLGMDDEQINNAAYVAEEAGSGTPSGIDNTCATYGGFITFEKNLAGGPNKIGRIELDRPVGIVLADSGITQTTKEVVDDVKSLKEKGLKEFGKIESEYTGIFTKALAALNLEDWEKVGELMNRNHGLLQKITVSCKELDEIQEVALRAGALGAKATGTGRGGSVIALAPEKEIQEKVAKAVEDAGYRAVCTTLGAK